MMQNAITLFADAVALAIGQRVVTLFLGMAFKGEVRL